MTKGSGRPVFPYDITLVSAIALGQQRSHGFRNAVFSDFATFMDMRAL